MKLVLITYLSLQSNSLFFKIQLLVFLKQVFHYVRKQTVVLVHVKTKLGCYQILQSLNYNYTILQNFRAVAHVDN